MGTTIPEVPRPKDCSRDILVHRRHRELTEGTHRHGLDIEDEEVQSHGHDDGPQQPDVEPRWHPQQ